MEKMLNLMRLQAEMLQKLTAKTRIAIVSSYDPNNYCAKVRIQPEDVETGWLPVLSPWVGNTWGLFCPPSPGDLVEVQFQEGDVNAGMICQRFFNDNARPLATPCGEFWLVHKSGSFAKFTNDGKVTLRDQAGSTFVMNADGTTTLASNLIVNGWVKASGDITDNYNTNTRTIAGMRSVYNSHTHTDPQGGSVSTPTGTM